MLMMLKTKWKDALSYRTVVTALVSLVLAGCFGGGQTVKPDYRFNEKEHKALGVFSVEVNDQCGKQTPIVHYRPADTSGKKARELELSAESKAAVPGFPKGWFFIQEEDAGDFFFTHVSYGKKARANVSRSPVTFANGRVTYLGALQISIPNCEQVIVTVSDQSDRDLPVFERYMKYFKSKYVIKQIIHGS